MFFDRRVLLRDDDCIADGAVRALGFAGLGAGSINSGVDDDIMLAFGFLRHSNRHINGHVTVQRRWSTGLKSIADFDGLLISGIRQRPDAGREDIAAARDGHTGDVGLAHDILHIKDKAVVIPCGGSGDVLT